MVLSGDVDGVDQSSLERIEVLAAQCTRVALDMRMPITVSYGIIISRHEEIGHT